MGFEYASIKEKRGYAYASGYQPDRSLFRQGEGTTKGPAQPNGFASVDFTEELGS